MSTLLITYDLNTPGQNYTKLYTYLKGFDGWCHPVESTWLVTTYKTPSDVRNELKALVDGNDRVLVVNITGDPWASFGMPPKVADWLRQYI